MKVSGFTFIRNARIYDYPIEEAIRSILPICDEVVVAVGKSDDDTLDIIKAIDPAKVRIVETVWDDTLREGGRVLAVETDKALSHIAKDADWAFYIQGDEVIHEQYLKAVYEGMRQCQDREEVDGLLFKYLHFYGSYDYVGASPQWYRHEIRVIRNKPGIYSYKDAQGFRKDANQKLNVYPIDAWIYHYGWVKEPSAMQRKQANFNKLWHDDEWMDRHVVGSQRFDYGAEVSQLRRFAGTHPEVMKQRIARLNWVFDIDISIDKRTFKEKIKAFLYRYLGLDFYYKNYRIIKGR
jgi:glycosyltransferase involved in cell wall biosynthesis